MRDTAALALGTWGRQTRTEYGPNTFDRTIDGTFDGTFRGAFETERWEGRRWDLGMGPLGTHWAITI